MIFLVKLNDNTRSVVAQIEYASAIRSLMYAMYCTRLDIAFVVCRLLRYTSNPSTDHYWEAIARVLGYLKRTKNLGLFYNNYLAMLERFCDANWITSVNNIKSTTRWIFTLGGVVSWASKKQMCITYSTMEVEFVAL